jgi:GT2 family glycosyltransferase
MGLCLRVSSGVRSGRDMTSTDSNRVTRGYLPATAFEHLEPTAVGVVDLERSITPLGPDGQPCAEHTDGLLLIRLHGQPLAVIHVQGNLGIMTQHELAAQISRSAGEQICQHVADFGCVASPVGLHTLVDRGLGLSVECRGGTPTNVHDSVAVIICSAGRSQQLARCVRSLLEQHKANFEIVVVDNRPVTGEVASTVKAIAADDPRVRYVAEERPGLSVARNRGIGETDATVVAFTDDDVVADAHWLEWLVAPLSEPSVTATCGMVLPLELETAAQKRFEQYAGFSKGVGHRRYDLHSRPSAAPLLYPYLGDVFGSGNSMAFRRAELVAWGGFDPALGAGSAARGGEDLDAFSNVILGGGQLVYEPRALCWHEHRKDDAGLHAQVFDYGVGFAAVLTKALSSDPRFYISAARSLPLAATLLRARVTSVRADPVADDTAAFLHKMARIQRAGMLRGPTRYVRGAVRSRRLRLGDLSRQAGSKSA